MTETEGNLLVTGMLRSGTTLLEKLLCGHPQLSVLAQPFPLVYVEVKRRFLETLGRADVRYPLSDLFLERKYAPADFTSFLERVGLERSWLEKAFADMEGYSGRKTAIPRSRLAQVLGAMESRGVDETLRVLVRELAHRREARLFGSKEVLCEEFVPHLADRGWKVLLVLRDPRDVVASLDHGQGGHFTGRRRPTLFDVRNWRKSVAFALHLRRHPGVLSIRYEDLVSRPEPVLAEIAAFLGIDDFDRRTLAGEIRDQSGELWGGNSSFGRARGVSRASVGRYRDQLSPEVARFVEATCQPELRRLGYPVSLARDDLEVVIRDWRDPLPVEREELRAYAEDPALLVDEIRRLELLSADSDPRWRPYFLFDDLQACLAASLEG